MTRKFFIASSNELCIGYGQTSSNGMLTNFNANANTLQKKESLKIFNDREQRQEEIERRLIG
jgi:hypothetical protein